MIWHLPQFHSEINKGAQLTVSETQLAVLVNEGQLRGAFPKAQLQKMAIYIRNAVVDTHIAFMGSHQL